MYLYTFPLQTSIHHIIKTPKLGFFLFIIFYCQPPKNTRYPQFFCTASPTTPTHPFDFRCVLFFLYTHAHNMYLPSLHNMSFNILSNLFSFPRTHKKKAKKQK
eukprot:UN10945